MLCQGLSRVQSNHLYLEILEAGDKQNLARLCKEDLFFLLTIGCKRADINRDFLYERCREVELEPDGYLDLWAREHYKSTIITFGKSIQDIITDPDNTTIGIFSHTRPIAKGFLDQIKREFESNEFLKALFPDVLYQNPKSEAPKWSLDSGIVVKRKTNPKEMTVEAWGLVDGQPTSKHFNTLVYDDVVTKESVTTPDQIKKTTEAMEMSYNLGAEGGKRRWIGTRYHANDTYRTIMDRGTATPRIKPATDNGKIDGKAVFLSDESLKVKRRDMGPYTFGSQMLQDPVADKAMGFKTEWLKYYKQLKSTKGWNLYLLADPASKKKKTSDYTVMNVIGLAPDENYYLIDAIRDRMNLTERAKMLIHFHRQYKPTKTAYEEYGLQADVEHIEHVMEEENYRFNIIRLGGTLHKEDRILKLVPKFEQHLIWLPEELYFTDYEEKRHNYSQIFKDDEFDSFPVAFHDDMLDCMARILDPKLGAEFPKIKKKVEQEEQGVGSYAGQSEGWMG